MDLFQALNAFAAKLVIGGNPVAPSCNAHGSDEAAVVDFWFVLSVFGTGVAIAALTVGVNDSLSGRLIALLRKICNQTNCTRPVEVASTSAIAGEIESLTLTLALAELEAAITATTIALAFPPAVLHTTIAVTTRIAELALAVAHPIRVTTLAFPAMFAVTAVHAGVFPPAAMFFAPHRLTAFVAPRVLLPEIAGSLPALLAERTKTLTATALEAELAVLLEAAELLEAAVLETAELSASALEFEARAVELLEAAALEALRAGSTFPAGVCGIDIHSWACDTHRKRRCENKSHLHFSESPLFQ